jgi:hypothetical protein
MVMKGGVRERRKVEPNIRKSRDPKLEHGMKRPKSRNLGAWWVSREAEG